MVKPHLGQTKATGSGAAERISGLSSPTASGGFSGNSARGGETVAGDRVGTNRLLQWGQVTIFPSKAVGTLLVRPQPGQWTGWVASAGGRGIGSPRTALSNRGGGAGICSRWPQLGQAIFWPAPSSVTGGPPGTMDRRNG